MSNPEAAGEEERYPDGEIDRVKEEIDWEHSYDRPPYDNLIAFLEAAPDDIDHSTVVSFSFKYIMSLGPKTTPRILDNMDAWDDQNGYSGSERSQEGGE